MQITPELIKRFFANNCTPQEVEAILLYFINNKEALDKYLSKDEWDQIAKEGQLDQQISETILNKLKQALPISPTKPYTKVFTLNKFRNISIAAVAVFVLVVLIWIGKILVNEGKNSTNNIVATAVKKQQVNLNKDIVIWKTFENVDRKPKELALPDGSVVIVYKNSVIKYPAIFESNKREIFMKGDAFFEVSKNKEKPFTVYAGILSTTALGTSFRVTVFDKSEKNIRVQLFTGKVMVKTNTTSLAGQKRVFLTPGEQVSFSGMQTTPSLIVARMTNPLEEPTVEKKLNQHLTTLNNELLFQNTPLTEVLDALTELYNVKITFKKEELNKMNFTGSINKKDPISNILKAITLMNGLELNESSDGFNITKTK